MVAQVQSVSPELLTFFQRPRSGALINRDDELGDGRPGSGGAWLLWLSCLAYKCLYERCLQLTRLLNALFRSTDLSADSFACFRERQRSLCRRDWDSETKHLSCADIADGDPGCTTLKIGNIFS